MVQKKIPIVGYLIIFILGFTASLFANIIHEYIKNKKEKFNLLSHTAGLTPEQAKSQQEERDRNLYTKPLHNYSVAISRRNSPLSACFTKLPLNNGEISYK